MIANLIFDLSGYGGSANFTAATTTDLINELNTLTGVAWYWDPADCKPKSNFYPGVPPVITTAYKVSFVDIDGDSTGFCNAGSLDFTKFNEIDLTAYGGSATTAIANNTDIVNAFAALTPSLIASVSGCSIIIDNWNRNSTPINVEVNNVGGCVYTSNTIPFFNLVSSRFETTPPYTPFVARILSLAQNSSGSTTIDWGDGNVITYGAPFYGGNHTYATAGDYNVIISAIDSLGGLPILANYWLNVDAVGLVTYKTSLSNNSLFGIKMPVFTINASDCNNVIVDMTMQWVLDSEVPLTYADYDVIFIINGATLTIPATVTNLSFTGFNIGSITIPSNVPFQMQLRHIATSEITGTVNSNLYFN